MTEPAAARLARHRAIMEQNGAMLTLGVVVLLPVVVTCATIGSVALSLVLYDPVAQWLRRRP